MPKVIQKEETIYKFEELSDDIKQEIVNEMVEDFYFRIYKDGRPNAAQEELSEIATKLLKDSSFKHADLGDIEYDFGYDYVNRAMFCFEYKGYNLGLDFPEINESLIEKFNNEVEWREKYSLGKNECEELINVLKKRETNALFDINLMVESTKDDVDYNIDYYVNCYADTEIGYCLEDMLKDWMRINFVADSRMIDELEGEFNIQACNWYEKLINIENWGNNDFEGYYYENGTFAGYEDDFE